VARLRHPRWRFNGRAVLLVYGLGAVATFAYLEAQWQPANPSDGSRARMKDTALYAAVAAIWPAYWAVKGVLTLRPLSAMTTGEGFYEDSLDDVGR